LERQRWGASIDRAQGVKVKDDEALLKKTITKKAKVKAKRTEKWTKRAQVSLAATERRVRVVGRRGEVDEDERGEKTTRRTREGSHDERDERCGRRQ
jgi:ribosomal protein S18